MSDNNYVNCKYCGELYQRSRENCPVCGADNEEYISESDTDIEIVECPCCGDKYPINQENCPMCRSDNPLYDVGADYCTRNNAELIDEDEEFIPIKSKKYNYEKQQAPNSKLVLAAFIGVIFIVISLFIGAVSGISRRASSKIGIEVFESQDNDIHRNE